MGVPLYTRRTSRGVQRPRSWSPLYSGEYVWRRGPWDLFMGWCRHLGYFPRFGLQVAWSVGQVRVDYPDVKGTKMKKPNVTAPGGKPEDTPPAVSVFLKKYPRLLAFLCDRWYDDGSPRWPGSVWIDSDISAAKAMLKEPTLCLCARIRAATLDDLMAAVETFLGLDSPPWEHDQYAAEKGVLKKKK
jgi:hypothetical protein